MADLYIADNNDDEIIVIDSETADGGTATVVRKFDVPATVLVGLQGLKIGEVNAYCIDWPSKNLVIFPKNTANGAEASLTRRFRFPSDVQAPHAVAIDEANNRGFVSDIGQDRIYEFALDTANGTTATKIKEIRYPSGAGAITGLAIDTDGTLYAADSGTDDVYAFPASTTDGTQPSGDDLRQFSPPSDVTNPQALEVFGDHVYIYDGGGFVINFLKTTAHDGTAAKVRKFSTPSDVGSGAGIGIYTPVAPTLAFAETTVRNGRTVRATLTSTSAKTGVTINDFSVDVGTVANLIEVTSGTEWTVDVTAPDTGTSDITLTFAAGGFTEGNAAATATVAHKPLPTVNITFALAKAISEVAVRATATYSEDVTDIALDDFSVDVGTVTNFNKASNRVYTVDITPPAGTNTVTLTLAEDAATEGNAEITAQIDAEPFTIAFANVPTSKTDNTFTCELHVSHPISGLSKNDILLNRVSGTDANPNVTSLNNAQLTITAIPDTNHHRLTLALTGTYNGTYQMRMRVGSVTSGGQTYPKALLLSSTFQIDSSYDPRLTPTLTFAEGSRYRGQKQQATLTFPSAVTPADVQLSDFDADVGSVSNLQAVGTAKTTWTVDVTAPTTGAGTLTLTFSEDSITEGNPSVTASFTYGAMPIQLSAPERGYAGETVKVALSVPVDTTGVALSDFQKNAGTVSNPTGGHHRSRMDSGRDAAYRCWDRHRYDS